MDVTLANGKPGHLDFKGASPTHKDVFVWIAWMEQPPYTHKPKNNGKVESEALERVKNAFKGADKVKNLDGTTGINLHLIYADNPVEHVNLLGDNDGLGHYDWTAFDQIKKSIVPRGPAQLASVIHFVLFAHQINLLGPSGGYCLSGLSRDIPSSDFIVSLGCNEDESADPPSNQGDPENQSGTFMHELGHNLGLRHGGADNNLNKPNYISVMNYLFQLSGIIRDGADGQFDYSRFSVSLDENHIAPQRGISSDPGLKRYGSKHLCDGQSQAAIILSLADPVRWDCRDEAPESGEIQFDVNRDGCLQVLQGQDDWSAIVLSGISSPSTSDCLPSDVGPTGNELDARMAALAPVLPVRNPRTTVTAKGIEIAWDPIILDRVRAYEVFRQRSDSERVSRLTQTRKTSFLDDSAVPGVQYTYRVGAVAVLPNEAVLKWVQERERGVSNMLVRFMSDLGTARLGLPSLGVSLPAAVRDLSFRTAQSAQVNAVRPKSQ